MLCRRNTPKAVISAFSCRHLKATSRRSRVYPDLSKALVLLHKERTATLHDPIIELGRHCVIPAPCILGTHDKVAFVPVHYYFRITVETNIVRRRQEIVGNIVIGYNGLSVGDVGSHVLD